MVLLVRRLASSFTLTAPEHRGPGFHAIETLEW
jgi:hypothetical protein